ncbi:hypothetical protein BaRGS_00008569 [Batillaria attramentaria]|uniref:Uncharacterized protein n=1 Tax=Batillaria attramentaria TaxID=370345 RepID=A0ABD0LM02_9CAEN
MECTYFSEITNSWEIGVRTRPQTSRGFTNHAPPTPDFSPPLPLCFVSTPSPPHLTCLPPPSTPAPSPPLSCPPDNGEDKKSKQGARKALLFVKGAGGSPSKLFQFRQGGDRGQVIDGF